MELENERRYKNLTDIKIGDKFIFISSRSSWHGHDQESVGICTKLTPAMAEINGVKFRIKDAQAHIATERFSGKPRLERWTQEREEGITQRNNKNYILRKLSKTNFSELSLEDLKKIDDVLILSTSKKDEI